MLNQDENPETNPEDESYSVIGSPRKKKNLIIIGSLVGILLVALILFFGLFFGLKSKHDAGHDNRTVEEPQNTME